MCLLSNPGFKQFHKHKKSCLLIAYLITDYLLYLQVSLRGNNIILA